MIDPRLHSWRFDEGTGSDKERVGNLETTEK